MTRILVKRRASLGDVLNTTPVVHRLRREDPSALIYVETLHSTAYRNSPHADMITAGSLVEDFDRIIDLNGCFESNRRIHQVDTNMLRAFGDAEGDKTIVLQHNPIEFLAEIDWGRVVVVHANVTWAQRTLPVAWWNEVLAALGKDGWITVLTGTSKDLNVAGMVDMRDKLSLASQANLIARAKVFLSGSSGLVTVAGSTETAIVCMVSMTPWENWAPYRHGEVGWNTFPIRTSLTCYGCDVDEPPVEYYPCKFGHNACMQSFDVEQVVEQVRKAAKEDRKGEFR